MISNNNLKNIYIYTGITNWINKLPFYTKNIRNPSYVHLISINNNSISIYRFFFIKKANWRWKTINIGEKKIHVIIIKKKKNGICTLIFSKFIFLKKRKLFKFPKKKEKRKSIISEKPETAHEYSSTTHHQQDQQTPKIVSFIFILSLSTSTPIPIHTHFAFSL